jgi:hypothetical protein
VAEPGRCHRGPDPVGGQSLDGLVRFGFPERAVRGHAATSVTGYARGGQQNARTFSRLDSQRVDTRTSHRERRDRQETLRTCCSWSYCKRSGRDRPNRDREYPDTEADQEGDTKPRIDTRPPSAHTGLMLSMLVPGRGKDAKQDFYCEEPGCSETVRDYPTPRPTCSLHGVPMKQGKKPRER